MFQDKSENSIVVTVDLFLIPAGGQLNLRERCKALLEKWRVVSPRIMEECCRELPGGPWVLARDQQALVRNSEDDEEEEEEEEEEEDYREDDTNERPSIVESPPVGIARGLPFIMPANFLVTVTGAGRLRATSPWELGVNIQTGQGKGRIEIDTAERLRAVVWSVRDVDESTRVCFRTP